MKKTYSYSSSVQINTPLTEDQAINLKVGQLVKISGSLYTARDQAHLRLIKLIKANQPLPIPIKGEIIFYAGPAPGRRSQLISSIGPTTAKRMDKFTLPILKAGIRGMIGKGNRSTSVIEAIKEYKAIYFTAVGGTAAYLSQFITQVEVAAFSDLGPEAIFKLAVSQFPVFVAIDAEGRQALVNAPTTKH